MKTLEEVQACFAQDHFATENGAVIESVGHNQAVCSMKLQDRHRNAMGAVMGGTYFTLADFAFAVASNWEGMGTVSLNASISYLGAARGDSLTASASCIKDGKTTSFYEVLLKDTTDRLVAVVHTTGYKVTAS